MKSHIQTGYSKPQQKLQVGLVFYDWHCYNSKEGLERPLKSVIEFYRRKMAREWRNRLLCGMLHASNLNRADTNM